MLDLSYDNIYVSENSESQKPIDVKISGDGAQMTRLSTYMLLSFSVLQSQQEVMSSQGRNVVCKWYKLSPIIRRGSRGVHTLF